MKHKRQTITKGSGGEDGEKSSDGKSSKGDSGSTSSKTGLGSPSDDKKSCQSCDLMTPLSPLTLSSSSSGGASTERGDKHHNNNNNNTSIKASPNSSSGSNNPTSSSIPPPNTSQKGAKGKSGGNSCNNSSNNNVGSTNIANPSDNNNSSFYKDSNANNSHLLQPSQLTLDATGLPTLSSGENIVVLKTEPMCSGSASGNITGRDHGTGKKSSSSDLKISGVASSGNNNHGLHINQFDSNNPVGLMDTKSPIPEKLAGSSTSGHITKYKQQSCISGTTPKSRGRKNHNSSNNQHLQNQLSSGTSSVPMNAGSVMCSYEYGNVSPVGPGIGRYGTSNLQSAHNNQMLNKYGGESYINGISAMTSRFQASNLHGGGSGSGGSSPIAATTLQNHHHQSGSGRSGKSGMNNVSERYGPYGSANIPENTAYCSYTGQSSGGGGGYPQETRGYHHSTGTVNNIGGSSGNAGTAGGYGMGYSSTTDLLGAGGTCRESGVGTAAFGAGVVISTSPNAASTPHGYSHYNTFGSSPGGSGTGYSSGSQQTQGQSQNQHIVVNSGGGAVGGSSSSYYHHIVPNANYPNHQGALSGVEYPSPSSSGPGSSSAPNSSPFSTTSNVVPYGNSGSGEPVETFFPGQQTSDSGYYDDQGSGYSSHHPNHMPGSSSSSFHHGSQSDVAMSGGGNESNAYAHAYPGYFDASSGAHQSENSSSEFNFLTNIANDYAPEYYQLS